MKSCLYLIVGVLLTKSLHSQVANYVVNPGFEDVQYLPWHPFVHWVTGWSGIDTTKGAFLPFTNGAPYYNVPGPSYDFQFPRNGHNFIGCTFYCNQSTCASSTRLYPKNRIKKILKKDFVYCARFYLVNRNGSPLGISDFGILLAGTEIDTIKQCRIPLPYLNPQITYTGSIIGDTLNWTAISGTYTAQGHEKYMVLGNFKSNAATNTAVINSSSLPQLYCDPYIDDVSLVEMELPAYAGNDTSIWFGDSVFIGREPDVGVDYACQWYLLPNDSVPIDTIAGLWVKPNAPATYVVRQQLWCSGVKWDTVSIHFLTVGVGKNPLQHFNVFPNPSEGWISFSGLTADSLFTVSVSDVMGRVVLNRQLENSHQKLNLDLPEGLYFVTVRNSAATVTRRITLGR